MYTVAVTWFGGSPKVPTQVAVTRVRGKPPADVDALLDAIAGVSQLAVALGNQLLGLDINPMIVLPKGEGALAVDAVVELQ